MMRARTLRLQTIWSDPLTTGIFTELQKYDVPWKEANLPVSVLNSTYHGGHSGHKRASPLARSLVDVDTNQLSANSKEALGLTCYSFFSNRWEKMYYQLELEYNPIHNYDMTETETETGSLTGSDVHSGTDQTTRSNTSTNGGTDTQTTTNAGTDTQTTTNSGTDTETTTHGGNDTKTNTGTQGVTTSNTSSVDGDSASTNQLAGFNSSGFVNDNKNTTTAGTDTTTSGSQTTTDNLTERMAYAHTVTEATQHGHSVTEATQHGHTITEATQHGHTVTDSGSESLVHGESIAKSESKSGSRSLTRSGNIGVTTTAQMLEQERELWAWNFFTDVVFKDIDTILTIQTY